MQQTAETIAILLTTQDQPLLAVGPEDITDFALQLPLDNPTQESVHPPPVTVSPAKHCPVALVTQDTVGLLAAKVCTVEGTKQLFPKLSQY